MDDPKRKWCSPRNAVTAIFVALGTTTFMVLYLAMSSAQDILAGTNLPTPVAILSLMMPFFLWTILAPHLIPRTPYLARILFASVAEIVGVFLVAASDPVSWKLVGFGFISLGSGIAETTFLSLTAFYDDITVKAYAGGTGLGFGLGPLYYTGMTSWACVLPTTTILGLVALPLLLVVLCVMLNKIGNADTSKRYKDVHYSALNPKSQENQPITAWRKVQTIWNSTPKMITLLVGVTAELMLIEAVSTTVVFPKAPFSPREHYLYYFSAFATGIMIGRLHALVISLVAPNIDVLVEKTWIFTTFLMANLILGVCNSWYHFIPSVWIVLALNFAHGIMAGAMYMNTYATAGKSENDARLKEISRAFTTLGSGGGMILGGFTGLWVETVLKEHCFEQTGSFDLCLTRSVFNATAQCSS